MDKKLSGGYKGVCKFCEKEKWVQKRLDPYILDVHNEKKKVVICIDCYRDRIDEV